MTDELGTWAGFMGWVLIAAGGMAGASALESLWAFAKSPEICSICNAVMSLLFCVAALCYSSIVQGKRYALCAELLMLAFFSLGVLLFAAACLDVLGIYAGKDGVLGIASLNKTPRVLRIVTNCAAGTFLVIVPCNHCFNLQLSRRTYRITLTSYVLAFVVAAFFSDAPAWGLLGLLLLGLFYLDQWGQWVKKLLKF
jgi:hypothetical protein